MATDELEVPFPPNFSARLGDELGSDPEEVLQAYREQVDAVRDAAMEVARQKAHMAALASRFNARGTVSHWDAERKAKLAVLEGAYREDAKASGEKVTDKSADAHSHSHPDYLRYIERARVELEQFEEQQAKLSESFATLDHAKGILAYLDAKLQMMRALSFAWGSEARLTPR